MVWAAEKYHRHVNDPEVLAQSYEGLVTRMLWVSQPNLDICGFILLSSSFPHSGHILNPLLPAVWRSKAVLCGLKICLSASLSVLVDMCYSRGTLVDHVYVTALAVHVTALAVVVTAPSSPRHQSPCLVTPPCSPRPPVRMHVVPLPCFISCSLLLALVVVELLVAAYPNTMS